MSQKKLPKMVHVRAWYFIVFIFLSVFLVFVNQYFKYGAIRFLGKLYCIIGVLLFFPIFLQKMRLQKMLVFAGLITWIIGATFFRVFIYGNCEVFSWASYLDPFFGICMLFIFGCCYDELDANRYIEILCKYKWLLLIYGLIIVLIYRFASGNHYPSFDSEGYIPLFVLSIRNSLHVFSFILLTFFYLCEKRAIFFVVSFIFVLFYLCPRFFTLSRKKSMIIGVSIIGLISIFFFSPIGHLVGGERYIKTFQGLVSFHVKSLSSVNERVREMKAAMHEDEKKPLLIFTGNGVGWNIPMRKADGGIEFRHYMHNTPAYIFFDFGILGLTLYLILIIYAALRLKCIFSNKTHSFFIIFFLISSIIGFSKLNLFTNPLVAYSLGAVFFTKKSKE